ncbi:hypothetical protein [Chryseobacterium gossypii]|uniref:hypothetical protein n=1 Tax=Chryseobacterium gossypii TaxID=3231602 RepID=UPI0035269493
MKKLVYLILLWSCNQDNKTALISYEIKVVKKQYIEIKISNNTTKNCFFVTPMLYFIKTSNENKRILTEDIITEIKYNYEDISDSKKNNNIITIKDPLNNNCNSIFLKLKKSEKIKLIYEIKNGEDLAFGKYSVIVNDLSCNIDSIRKKIPIGYSYYTDSLLIPNKINIQ